MKRLPPRRRGGRRRPRGSSLIEMLIGLLVLSLGVLAMGGLAVAAQRLAKMSQFESLAMQAAVELGERMRANIPGFEAGAYDMAGASVPVATSGTVCAATRCTPAEIGAIELADWASSLGQRLPAGSAVTQRDAASPLAADIWILWLDPDLRLGDGFTLAVPRAHDECPAEALLARSASIPAVRCAHFRISL